MLPQSTRWLVMLVSLPPSSSRVRVGVWRKLKRIGAVSLKGAAWILPEREETTERFQWLLQEIQSLKGEAALLHVDHIEPMHPEQLAELLRRERTAEYEAVRSVGEAALGAIGQRGRLSGEAVKRTRTRLAAARRELDRIWQIDYLHAPAGDEVRSLFENIEMKLAATDKTSRQKKDPKEDGMPPPRSLWVTRPRPHIDRIGSAWLVRRFYDPKARFAFAKEPAAVTKGVPFDVLGAEFGHHGEDCTFETILRRLRLKDRRLRAIAEVVHEADLQDGKYTRAEVAGIDLTLKGLAATHADDHDLLEIGMAVFDGLYATLGNSK